MASINLEALDEYDRKLLENNPLNEDFMLYKPPAPPQSSQTDKYIKNLLGAQSQDYVVARGRPLTQTNGNEESVPRIASSPQESKKSRKRKRIERQANTKADQDAQEDIVNFTSKKLKEIGAPVTTFNITDQSSAVKGTAALSVPHKSASEPQVIVQPNGSPMVQPAVSSEISGTIHTLKGTGMTSDPDSQRWLLNINKIVAEHSSLEGNAKTLEKRVHELQTQLSGKEVLARKIAGFGTDIDRIQRSMREGRSHGDQVRKDSDTLRKEHATAIKDLRDLQLKFNTSQRQSVQLCRDYESQAQQLQDSNKRLTDQLSDKVGLLAEARGQNAELRRELALQLDKWKCSTDGLTEHAEEFARTLEKVDKRSVRDDGAITELCVAIGELHEAFSDKDKDRASEEARDKTMRVLEEVKTAVAALATNDQGQEIARSIGTLNTTVVEKFDAVLVHGQDHRTNASLSAEIMCRNLRIADLNEENAQLKKDLNTANESVIGLRVQSLTQADSEMRLRAESARLQSRLDDRVTEPSIAEERKALEAKMTADLETCRAELSSEFRKLNGAWKAAVANENKALKYEKLETQKLLTAANQTNARLEQDLSNVKQANDHLSSCIEEAKRETNEYKEKLQQAVEKLQQTEASLQQAEPRVQQPETRASSLTAQKDQQSLTFHDAEAYSELSEVPSSESGRLEQSSQNATPRPNTASKRLPSGSGRDSQSVKHGNTRSASNGEERESMGSAEGTDEETQGSLYIDSQSQRARASKTPATKVQRRQSTRAAKSSAKSGNRYDNRFGQELGY